MFLTTGSREKVAMTHKLKRVSILYHELFDNETPPSIVHQSEAISETEIDQEVEAIDKMLAGDDGDFDKLEY